jgi:DNA repair exonuclease SbcCD ATPase subunit
MNSGNLSLLQTGVWIIPLVLLGSVLLLFLLVRYWQKTTQRDLKYIRSELRRYQTLRRELELVSQGYSTADPEPFGSRVVELREQLIQLDGQLQILERQQVAIQEKTRFTSLSRWQAIIGAPFWWFNIRQEITTQSKNLAGIQSMVSGAKNIRNKLAGLPWETALQARQVRELKQQLAGKIEKLSGNKVHGDSLDTLLQHQSDLQAALNQIPVYFFQAEQENVLEKADPQTTAQVHAILNETRPKLEEMLIKTGQWEAQYAETTSKVARMRQALDRLGPLLDKPPAGLDLAPIQTQIGQLNIIAQNLQATLSRLEVESMQVVANEAAKVYQAARDINRQLKNAHQQHNALNQILAELGDDLSKLSDQFATLGTSPVHPIAWGVSRNVLTDISRKAGVIGPAQKARQPQQVEQDLNTASQLNIQQKELTATCQQMAVWHAELIKLIESPDLSQGIAWVQSTQTLLGRVKVYDPDNWARADGVATLPAELHSLSQSLRKLAGDPKTPIPEDDLRLRLEETRLLSSRVQELRARVNNIQNRLEQIQQTERTAEQNLESARADLAQVNLLVRSNTFLAGLTTQELSRSQRQIDQLTTELAQRERGALDKKARIIAALLDRINQNGNLWVARLSKEIEAQKLALTEKINALKAIADLDDPIVAEIQRLQATIGQLPAIGQEYQRDELLLELKRRSDLWQTCMAAIRALEDVESPVLDSYHEAAQYRQYARELFENIPSAMREQRSWPPTSLSIKSELAEFEQIEAQWNALKGHKVKAITLVAQLGGLSARYQTVAEKTRQIAERIVQEQERVEALEAELDRLSQLWQVQWQAHQSNQSASEEIRRLLDQLDNDRELLIRQCRQGARNYQQAVQALEAWQRRIRMAQIAIDPNHVLDINGRVIQYR